MTRRYQRPKHASRRLARKVALMASREREARELAQEWYPSARHQGRRPAIQSTGPARRPGI